MHSEVASPSGGRGRTTQSRLRFAPRGPRPGEGVRCSGATWGRVEGRLEVLLRSVWVRKKQSDRIAQTMVHAATQAALLLVCACLLVIGKMETAAGR